MNLAARMCVHANAGEVVVSRAVRDLSIGKPFDYHDLGHVEFKGFRNPSASRWRPNPRCTHRADENRSRIDGVSAKFLPIFWTIPCHPSRSNAVPAGRVRVRPGLSHGLRFAGRA